MEPDPFDSARIRLNHNDLKRFRGYLMPSPNRLDRATVLLGWAWPALAAKINAFLSAIREIWGYGSEEFEKDAEVIRKVVSSLERTAAGPISEATVDAAVVMLDDLWWAKDRDTRGLLSGERFHGHRFELYPVRAGRDFAEDLRRAQTIVTRTGKEFEAISEGELAGGSVGGYLSRPTFWEARYLLDRYLWLPQRRLGELGDEIWALAGKLIAEDLTIVMDEFLALSLTSEGPQVTAALESRSELGATGLERPIGRLADLGSLMAHALEKTEAV